MQADPGSVFLYRREPRELAEKLGVDCSKMDGPTVPVVYSVSFADPAGYFLATRIQMRNKDVIFAANAQSVDIAKFAKFLNTMISVPNNAAVLAPTSRRGASIATFTELSRIDAALRSIGAGWGMQELANKKIEPRVGRAEIAAVQASLIADWLARIAAVSCSSPSPLRRCRSVRQIIPKWRSGASFWDWDLWSPRSTDCAKPHFILLGCAAIVVAAYAIVLHEQLAANPGLQSVPHPLWAAAAKALGTSLFRRSRSRGMSLISRSARRSTACWHWSAASCSVPIAAAPVRCFG